MMGGYGFGEMFLGGLLMLGFWVLVIAGVIWLVVTLARGASTASPQTNPGGAARGETPFDILKARYAKGEITKEQFDAIKKDLE